MFCTLLYILCTCVWEVRREKGERKCLNVSIVLYSIYNLLCFCLQLFNIYIKKAAEIYGVPKTRQIYEKAIELLSEDNTREMCLRFAEMETKLGEIDRARAIYAHCSQICDPRVKIILLLVTIEFLF